MVTLRCFQEGDAQACCNLINANVPAMAGLNEAARAFIVAKNVPSILAAELAGFKTLVAISAHGIVGVGALDGPEVKRVHVHPAAHRRGIGKLIMHELEALARREGMAHLQLSASLSSVSFYSAIGFHFVESVTLVIGDATFQNVAMAKNLLPRVA